MVVIGPDGMPHGRRTVDGGRPTRTTTDRHVTDLVEQPAKVMRIGSMIRQLLEEVKAAPLDEASRTRLAEIHAPRSRSSRTASPPSWSRSWSGSPCRSTPSTPSEAELRIAQAQLVGWLEGLFHGIQTAIYAQQMAARAQLEQMRRALPPGHDAPCTAAGERPARAARATSGPTG